jgi:hypothetical protein
VRSSITLELRQFARWVRRHLIAVTVTTALAAVAIAVTAIGLRAAYVIGFAPLPYDSPDSLYVVGVHDAESTMGPAAVNELVAVGDAVAPHGQIAIHTPTGLVDAETWQEIPGTLISDEFLKVLGTKPLGAAPHYAQAVISHSLWRSKFAQAPIARGLTLRTTTGPIVVTGVMPVWFDWPRGTDAWIVSRDLTRGSATNEIGRVAYAIARCSNCEGFLSALSTVVPKGSSLVAIPMQRYVVGDDLAAIMLVAALLATLFFVSLANTTNLAVADILARSAEFATKTACGAKTIDVLAGIVLRSSILWLCSAGLAGILIMWGLPAVTAAVPFHLPRARELAADALPVWILAFELAIAGAVTVAAIVAMPLLRRQQGRGHVRWGLLNGLTALQVSSAAAVMVIAWSFSHQVSTMRFDPGVASIDRVAFISMRQASFSFDEREAVTRNFETALERIASNPAVAAVGWTSVLPYADTTSTAALAAPHTSQSVRVESRVVDNGFFSVMTMRPIYGRLFTPDDTFGAPAVAIVNEQLATVVFGSPDRAVGKVVTLSGSDGYRIVGVVPSYPDVRDGKSILRPEIYRPLTQIHRVSGTVLVRFTEDSRFPLREIETVLKSELRGHVIAKQGTLAGLTERLVAAPKFYFLMAAVVGGTSMITGFSGVCAVVLFIALMRRREVAIRLALGGRLSRIGLVAAMRLCLGPMLGAACGVLVAATLLRFWTVGNLVVPGPSVFRLVGVFAVLSTLSFALTLISWNATLRRTELNSLLRP